VIAHDDAKPARPGTRAAARAAKEEEFQNATTLLRAEYEQARAALSRLLFVERQRLRVRLVDAGLGAGAALCVAAAATTMTILAVMMLIATARRGMAAWTDNAWWGDVVIALVLLASIVVALVAVRRSLHKKALAVTERHLAAKGGSVAAPPVPASAEHPA
jgi:hypothetical protein